MPKRAWHFSSLQKMPKGLKKCQICNHGPLYGLEKALIEQCRSNQNAFKHVAMHRYYSSHYKIYLVQAIERLLCKRFRPPPSGTTRAIENASTARKHGHCRVLRFVNCKFDPGIFSVQHLEFSNLKINVSDTKKRIL